MIKLKLFSNHRFILGLILITTFLLRVYRLDYPKGYVFDEVYHGFTAKEYAKGEKVAWEYWTSPPAGVAYEWTHPPLAKEIMAISLRTFSTQAHWAFRLPGVILGVLSVLFVYLIAKTLFEKVSIALLSSFIFSMDGLNFVQSRTGMNDIYLVTFTLACIYFLLNKNFFFSSVFLGLGLSSKWSDVYLLFFIVVYLIFIEKAPRKILLFILIPPLIYALSYIPFFLLNHSLGVFIELQKQMWWYHTGLKATHNYSSPWWSWPFNLKPVWYFVEHFKGGFVANIFATGNPAIFWMGFVSIFISLFESIFRRVKTIALVVSLYLLFLLPWVASPRIMFLYHYSPCVPFLSISLSYQLNKLQDSHKDYFIAVLALIVIGFIFIYPFLVGIPMPENLAIFK